MSVDAEGVRAVVHAALVLIRKQQEANHVASVAVEVVLHSCKQKAIMVIFTHLLHKTGLWVFLKVSEWGLVGFPITMVKL